MDNKDLLAESKSRYISFPGTFTPVSHSCRAPLGNGKLCQRQDRLKVAGQTLLKSTVGLSRFSKLYVSEICVLQCPFHGRIIPRDQEGRPCSKEDRLREEQEERRKREQQPGKLQSKFHLHVSLPQSMRSELICVFSTCLSF